MFANLFAKYPWLRKLISFGLIGGVATLLYAVLATALTLYAGWNSVLASAVAYTICGIWSYFGNRVFTFQSQAKVGSEVPRFLITSVIGYGVALLIPYIFTQKLAFDPRIGIAIVCVAVPLMNFLLLSLFVFKPKTAQ